MRVTGMKAPFRSQLLRPRPKRTNPLALSRVTFTDHMPGFPLRDTIVPCSRRFSQMHHDTVRVANLDEAPRRSECRCPAARRRRNRIPPRVILAHGESLRGADLELEESGPVGHLEIAAGFLAPGAAAPSRSNALKSRPSHAPHAPPASPRSAAP